MPASVEIGPSLKPERLPVNQAEMTRPAAAPGRTLIVIPAHDEELNIGQVLEELDGLGLGHDVLVVDDASSDSTRHEVERRGKRCLRLSANLGYGGAVQSGFKYALQHGYDLVVQMDGDCQHDPRSIIEVQHADGASTVIVDQTQGIGIWHSLGIFDFKSSATVILTCPNDGGSVSVDAVRFRPISNAPGNPPRGTVPVDLGSRPKNIKVDDDTVLALRGTLTANNSNESEDWVAAIVSPVGSGSESTRITACRLHIDSNGNGLFDPADTQLGDALTFGSDVRSVTFDGFQQTLTNGVPVTFFVTADIAPAPAVVSARREPAGRESALLASSAALALVILLLGRRRPLVLGLAALLLLPLLFLSGPGCSSGGGGGGGSGSQNNLRLELSTVVTRGTTTGTPSTVEDLPAEGWSF